MKLRRVMAAVAVTAAVAPVALLSAPAAFATESPSASASAPAPEATESATTTPPATDTSTPAEAPSTSASATTTPPAAASTSAAPKPSGTPKPTESEPDDEPPFPTECTDTKVDVSIKGLPGKIAAGSGWHKFRMNVRNSSKHTLTDLGYFAAAAADKDGEDIFKTKKVTLQAWDPKNKVWDTVDSEGFAVGYVGYTDKLMADYEVDIPLRINVKANAPVGAGFSLGAGVYTDEDADCLGFGETAYKFRIVAAGTQTGGTKPQEGGKVPVPTGKPDPKTTTQVEGSLAETGSSSALPTIALVGGVAVVAGAGAVFAVRRRKAGSAA